MMKTRKLALALLAVVALAAAGCSGDIAKQVTTNEQLRGQVLTAIAQRQDLALQAVDRMVASDSLRGAVVDHLLQNKDVAKQVIVRVATNPEAFDMVLTVAVRDSAMRGHVLTLVKGIQMAGEK
jgi:hypothetical protein